MKTSTVWQVGGLAVALTVTMASCATPDPAQPSHDHSASSSSTTRYQVQSLTKDGEPVNLGDWTQTALPDSPVGGLIFPINVCNNPSFLVTAVDSQAWTVEKTGNETEEGCSDEDLAVKNTAIAVLQGELTVQEMDGRIELANPPYLLVLEQDR